METHSSPSPDTTILSVALSVMAPTAWRPLWLVTRAAAVAVLALVALLPASAQMENGAGCGDLLPGAAQEGMCLAADPVLGARCSRRDAETTSSDVADWNRRLRDLLTEEEEPRAGAGAWESDLAGLRERVVTMFYHAYDNYMQQAFPHDELLPLSCQAVDNFGGYALTLVDSLDMLAVLGNRSEFSRAVGLLRDRVTFNIDANVSVFETNIRVMGGLLSAHLLASDATLQLMPSYDGCLLDMAVDLGERLLPAFNTATGLPYGTVNLNKGVHRSETSISSSACAGTLLLEFATLSRLSGRPVFERVAKRSLLALWARRSSLGLVGGHIDILTGEWTHKDSGVGTSIDSYYEYLIKGHVMTGEYELLVMFQQAYGAAKSFLQRDPWFCDVNMDTGLLVWPVYNSLQSFWPALEVLAGNVVDARRTHEAYYGVWRKFGYTPEGFNLAEGRVNDGQKGYPLRPELIESTLYLWQATSDPHYIEVGRDMLASLERTRVPCGHAAVGDVETHTLSDRMDSYFLSETLKYLYLLFTPGHWVTNGSFVFTTEGHPLPIISASGPQGPGPSAHAAEPGDGGRPRPWADGKQDVDGSFRSLRDSENPVLGVSPRDAPLPDERAAEESADLDTALLEVQKQYGKMPRADLEQVARQYSIDPKAPSLVKAIMQHLRFTHDPGATADQDDAEASAEAPKASSEAAAAELDPMTPMVNDANTERENQGQAEEGGVGADRTGVGMLSEQMLTLDRNASAALEQLLRARRLQGRCMQTPYAARLSSLDLLLPAPQDWASSTGGVGGADMAADEGAEALRVLRARIAQNGFGQVEREYPAAVSAGTLVMQAEGKSVNIKVSMGGGGGGASTGSNLWDALSAVKDLIGQALGGKGEDLNAISGMDHSTMQSLQEALGNLGSGQQAQARTSPVVVGTTPSGGGGAVVGSGRLVTAPPLDTAGGAGDGVEGPADGAGNDGDTVARNTSGGSGQCEGFAAFPRVGRGSESSAVAGQADGVPGLAHVCVDHDTLRTVYHVLKFGSAPNGGGSEGVPADTAHTAVVADEGGQSGAGVAGGHVTIAIDADASGGRREEDVKEEVRDEEEERDVLAFLRRWDRDLNMRVSLSLAHTCIYL